MAAVSYATPARVIRLLAGTAEFSNTAALHSINFMDGVYNKHMCVFLKINQMDPCLLL